MSNSRFEQFIRNMTRVMATVNTRLQRDLTLRSRVSRRFSMADIAGFLDLPLPALTGFAESEPAFPEGETAGRERSFTPGEIMQIRALLASSPAATDIPPKPGQRFLHWRRSGEPLKIVTFGAQKGGTGKSLAAAHFAQYMNLYYGVRAGVIDADPQATLSLYFASADLPLFHADTPSIADFMGLGEPGSARLTAHSPQALNEIWHPTPWPGIRLIPGGANIQNGDIALFFLSRQQPGFPVYRILKDALSRWEAANPPRVCPGDFRDASGNFQPRKLQQALDESLDLIVIDQQPSLTLMQLNGLISADNVVIPQTMKGFDLATLSTYISNIGEYLDFITGFDPDIVIGNGAHMILPSIVQEQNDRDTGQIMDLVRRAPGEMLKVWYSRSDAIANAADEYKSIYEYAPPRNRRDSALAFMHNANAVNDAIARRVWPGLGEGRGFEDGFIARRWD